MKNLYIAGSLFNVYIISQIGDKYMKEYCGNCKHKESCKGTRTDINDDFNWCWCYQKEQK